MLFTRDEMVEMGLLKPEVLVKPAEVATAGLLDCQKVAKVSEVVATDLTPLFIYIYFSWLLGCKNILEVEGELYQKYSVKTYVSPYNPSNLPNLEIFVSLWHTYGCADYSVVASPEGTLQPELVDLAVEATKTSNIYPLIVQDWGFYKRFGHLPGDSWDGIITDDGITLDIFEAKEARLINDIEVVESAVIERQRVKPGRTMLSLMYDHNVRQFTWFEGQDGQWHCYNNEGLT
jgi:hypothetical protein